MKTVLCFGDSNTWGYNPVNGERHNYSKRWTTVLQNELGSEYLVIPEGLNGRTTVWDDPIEGYTEGHKNGRIYLPPCLQSHKPLDMVVIMLGTNDLKKRFSLPAADIAAGVGALVDIVHKSECGPGNSAPDVLVLIPPEVRKLSGFAEMFEESREKSLLFPSVYSRMAKEKNIPVLDIGTRVRFSGADGIHFEENQLAVLGRLVAQKIKALPGQT